MKWLLLISGLLGLLVTLMALIGALLPREHTAVRTAGFRHKPGDLYAAVRNFPALPSWRRNLRSTEALPGRDGHAAYREVSNHGSVTYLVREDKPGERLVLQIADEDLPYGGTWTFEFSPDGDGSRVRITEHGFVKNVLFRFLARFLFGYATTLENYLCDLGRKFGETIEPRP